MKMSLKTFKRATLASVIGLAGAWSMTSHAGTATSNLDVTASVAANCTISTAALAFGAYDPISANASADLTATGTVSVTCTKGEAVEITLGQGANADTGSTDAAPLRRLKDAGTNHLSYSLFSEATHTTAWTNDAAGDVVIATALGTQEDKTVYGKITAGQNVPVGAYTDTVVATVTF